MSLNCKSVVMQLNIDSRIFKKFESTAPEYSFLVPFLPNRIFFVNLLSLSNWRSTKIPHLTRQTFLFSGINCLLIFNSPRFFYLFSSVSNWKRDSHNFYDAAVIFVVHFFRWSRLSSKKEKVSVLRYFRLLIWG